jgi:hypothetical protein
VIRMGERTGAGTAASCDEAIAINLSIRAGRFQRSVVRYWRSPLTGYFVADC